MEFPFFFLGTPSGHDVEFHLNSWLDVLLQWRQGILYPRWASLAHFGYGEPRFVFYPPASWMVGATLGTIFPWTWAASIYVWMVLVAAGISMFFLARRWLTRRDAMFAAILYAVNPYHLVIVYWRSAFAELLASCLVPLLLLCVLKAREEARSAVIPLSIVLALAWLTNAPAAVMIHYSLVLLLLVFAWQDRSPRLLLVGGVATVVAACLSAFYLLPAIYEQRWVNIAEAVSAGSRPQDNFLFVHTTDADHDSFNRIVSWIAVVQVMATFVGLAFIRTWRRKERASWTALAAWTSGCTLLMFSVSGVLWGFLPKLRFMQFPWRWMLCLSMIFSLVVTITVRHLWARAALYVVMLLVIGLAWQKIQAPWWDTAADLREMQDNVDSGAGYEGTDEYTPIGAEPSAVDKDARRVVVDGPQRAAIHVFLWRPESKLFTAEMSGAGNLALHLFNYPAWQIQVNGRPVVPSRHERTGQMLVPVQAGTNRVEMTFIRTWDRTAGGWISAVAWLGLIVAMLFPRRVVISSV